MPEKKERSCVLSLTRKVLAEPLGEGSRNIRWSSSISRYQGGEDELSERLARLRDTSI